MQIDSIDQYTVDALGIFTYEHLGCLPIQAWMIMDDSNKQKQPRLKIAKWITIIPF